MTPGEAGGVLIRHVQSAVLELRMNGYGIRGPVEIYRLGDPPAAAVPSTPPPPPAPGVSYVEFVRKTADDLARELGYHDKPAPVLQGVDYGGSVCTDCGGLTRRAGSCQLCTDCGSTTGCG